MYRHLVQQLSFAVAKCILQKKRPVQMEQIITYGKQTSALAQTFGNYLHRSCANEFRLLQQLWATLGAASRQEAFEVASGWPTDVVGGICMLQQLE